MKVALIWLIILTLAGIGSGCRQENTAGVESVPTVYPSPASPGLTATPLASPVPPPTSAPPAPETVIPVITGRQNTGDMATYQPITLQASMLEVSSVFQDFGPEALLKETSFWHVVLPHAAKSEWVRIDLGEARPLTALAVKPRPDNPGQLWRGDGAELQASPDGGTWAGLVRLKLENSELNSTEWITFVLPGDTGAHRYYRLFITSPEFASLAGLRVYGEGGAEAGSPVVPGPTPEKPVLPEAVGFQWTGNLTMYRQIELQASMLEVSSVLRNFGIEALLKGDGFWHVVLSPKAASDWLKIDLGEACQLAALAVRPRSDNPEQLWRGDGAELQASDDGATWTGLVRLKLENSELNSSDWITFLLPGDIGEYRYYRLFITSPEFVSLAGLRVYGTDNVTASPT
jgi:hypothetical protein